MDALKVSGPGLRALAAVADLWALDEDRRRGVLGHPDPSTYRAWTRTASTHRALALAPDVLTRVSAVLGIHRALGILFAEQADALCWLHGPHYAPMFGGRAPLELVTSGSLEDLLAVRRFLDAATTGTYMPPNDVDRNFQSYRDEDIVFA